MAGRIIGSILHKLAMIAPGGYKIRPHLHRMRGVNIGENVWISQYVYIDEIHPEAVTIGNNVTIGLRSSIITHLYWGPKDGGGNIRPVVIEDDVFIGPHCVILPSVHIGAGSVIQAGTTVSRNVPAGFFWGAPKAGMLAKVSTPLTNRHSHQSFIDGLRPVPVRKKN